MFIVNILDKIGILVNNVFFWFGKIVVVKRGKIVFLVFLIIIWFWSCVCLFFIIILFIWIFIFIIIVSWLYYSLVNIFFIGEFKRLIDIIELFLIKND